MAENDKIVNFSTHQKKANPYGDTMSPNNGNGGEPPMGNDYATTRELRKLSKSTKKHLDKIDNRLNDINRTMALNAKILGWMVGVITAGIIVPMLALLYKALF